MITFKEAIENLKEAGANLNSAYYMEGYDKKYPNVGLWKLIKEGESIGNKILVKILDAEEAEDNK